MYSECKVCTLAARKIYQASPAIKARKKTLKQSRTAQLRIRAFELLGGVCVCCGANSELELDHIKPAALIRRATKCTNDTAENLRAIVKEGAKEFQLLCRGCNRWKYTGPYCPCPDYDRNAPGWREYT